MLLQNKMEMDSSVSPRVENEMPFLKRADGSSLLPLQCGPLSYHSWIDVNMSYVSSKEPSKPFIGITSQY